MNKIEMILSEAWSLARDRCFEQAEELAESVMDDARTTHKQQRQARTILNVCFQSQRFSEEEI